MYACMQQKKGYMYQDSRFFFLSKFHFYDFYMFSVLERVLSLLKKKCIQLYFVRKGLLN